MELTFNKVGKKYEAEFELTADANLHIEFESAAPVKLYQRTTGGGWDLCNDAKNEVGKAIDVDLTALIYPKFIKVVSDVEPTYAAVTSAGEVTEIKSQDKSVEVTSNGTIEVTPDAGFAYLNSVKVKTNVAQSGEGGGSTGGGGSASSWRYFDFTAYSDDVLGFLESIPSLMHTMRIVINGKDVIVPMGTTGAYNITEEFIKNIKAVGADMSALVKNHPLAPNATTMAEVYSTDIGGMTIEQGIKDYWKLPEITEEEFYNLDNGGGE